MTGTDECIGMIRRREYKKALWHLSRIATREPENPEVHSLKGMALYKLGRYPKAIEVCDRVQGIGDELFQKYSDLAADLRWNWQDEEALEPQRMAARMYEAPLRAKYVKAKSLFRMGMPDEALDWINAEMHLDPSVSGERSILATILSEMCCLDEAFEPDDVRSARLLGALFREFWRRRLDRRARLEEKLDTASFIADTRQNDADAHAEMAKILNDMNKWPRALEAIDRALDLNPLNAGNRYIRAEILLALDRRRDCDREIKEALTLNPSHPEALAFSGFRLCKKGYNEKGRSRIKSAFRKDSLGSVTSYYEAYARFHAGNRIEALDLCRSAMLRYPEDRRLRFLMTTILDNVFWL